MGVALLPFGSHKFNKGGVAKIGTCTISYVKEAESSAVAVTQNPEHTLLQDAEARVNSTTTSTDGFGVNGDTQEGITTPKVYIRGLDTLTTADIKGYARERFSLDHYVKAEWIDDTSANIVYENMDAALGALKAFSAFSASSVEGGGSDVEISTLDLRPAKRLSRHPGVELLVRQAVKTDVKRPRAHEASRFYLLNPDKDPRERRWRQEQRQRNRRDGRDRGQRRGDGIEDEEYGSGGGAVAASFDVNMYDDDAGITDGKDDGIDIGTELRRSRPRRYSGGYRQTSDRTLSGAQRNGDLFDRRDTDSRRRRGGSRRDRSMSPDDHNSTNDDDVYENNYGRLGYEERRTERPRVRSRRRSTPPPAERFNAGKELFPVSSSNTATALQQPNGNKELLPHKITTLLNSSPTSSSSSRKRPRELFPHKTNVSNHRRTAAFDAADETAEIYSPKKRSVFSEGATDGSGADLSRDLSSRITRDSVRSSDGAGRLTISDDDDSDDGPENAMANGTGVQSRGRGRGIKSSRTNASSTMTTTTTSLTQPGFSIRGVADPTTSIAAAGFSIQGAADVRGGGGGPKDLSVKELFPSKLGGMSTNNEGKELFGQKIRGRGAQRQRAQDMFF